MFYRLVLGCMLFSCSVAKADNWKWNRDIVGGEDYEFLANCYQDVGNREIVTNPEFRAALLRAFSRPGLTPLDPLFIKDYMNTKVDGADYFTNAAFEVFINIRCIGNGSLKALRDRYFASKTKIEKIFGWFGLPRSLKYIAMAESKFLTDPRSSVGARSMWQLMPDTFNSLKKSILNKKNSRPRFAGYEYNHLVEKLKGYNYWDREEDGAELWYRDVEVSALLAAQYLSGSYLSSKNWAITIASYHMNPAELFQYLGIQGTSPTEGYFYCYNDNYCQNIKKSDTNGNLILKGIRGQIPRRQGNFGPKTKNYLARYIASAFILEYLFGDLSSQFAVLNKYLCGRYDKYRAQVIPGSRREFCRARKSYQYQPNRSDVLGGGGNG